MRSLNGFVDDSIDDTQGVEFKLNTVHRAIRDFLILFIEMIEELHKLVQV